MTDPLLPYDSFNQQLEASVHPADWKNPDPDGVYNMVVIGGGTAGLVTAAIAANLGAKTALIEKSLLGGDCLNVGCVPSKAMIHSARMAANDPNITDRDAAERFESVMRRMRQRRAVISPHDSAKRFTEMGVDVFFGEGRFTSGSQIEVDGKRLSFRKACIATGGRPRVPDLPGIESVEYLTNENLFSITKLPETLVVVGGGPIGCEMAQTFARLGSQVTLIHRGLRIMDKEDPAASQIVHQALTADGVKILIETDVAEIRQESDKRHLKIKSKQTSTTSDLEADQILFSTGRVPNVLNQGLEQAGIDFDQSTGIVVNDKLRTTNKNVYAAGDVASKFKFTHAADFLARAVIQNSLFPLTSKKASQLIIPRTTYTSPELAHVGITAEEAQQRGIKIDTFMVDYAELDRAIVDDATNGFVKAHVRKGTDRLLGATVVGPHAGDLIGELTLAMTNQIGLSKIGATIHPYPTYAEAIRKLGDQYSRSRFTGWKKSLLKKWFAWLR